MIDPLLHHDHVKRRDHYLGYGHRGLSQTGNRLGRAVRVHGAHATIVPRVHRGKHRPSLWAPNLPHNHPIWPHPERILYQIVHGDLPAPLYVGWAGLQSNPVFVRQLKLGGVFNRDDALPLGDEGASSVEGSRLSAASSSREEDVCRLNAETIHNQPQEGGDIR